MRYSASFITAIIISFFLFLGMSLLITNKNSYQSSDFEISNFNMITETETPIKVKQEKPKIPEKEEVKQPPAAPKIDISQDYERPENPIPTGNGNLENMDLTGLDIPFIPNIHSGPGIVPNDGDLILVAGIQPIYPPKAARAGIEGWVKVEIQVNEYGLVSHVEVLDSNPKRIFDNATKRAMFKSKFKPLVIDGKAFSQTAIQVIEFKMDD